MTTIATSRGDYELIREHLKGSADAFPELVARHINMVYSAARRQVGDPHLADDVTQAVFMLLAKKAPSLSSSIIFSAWLHRATRYCAANALRMKVNRLRHERRAAEMNARDTNSDPRAEWKRLSPFLDEAINKLRDKDRQVVVLHYLDGKTHAAVAEQLGLEPAAARKRVERALVKLRRLLLRADIDTTLPALTATIAARVIETAPPYLISSTESVVIYASTPSAKSIAIMKGAIKTMIWTQAKTIGVIAIAAIAISTGAAVAVHGNSAGMPVPNTTKATPQMNARETLVNIASAIRNGDVDFVREHISWSTPGQKLVVDNQARMCGSVARFRKAYGEVFGDTAERQLPQMVGPTNVSQEVKVT
ncbi:MAG TPA: sigma-70 family RNA polymerase sigma factor, partial [Tepidisphaeraceae bacterium]|nr:sigma-70 family RNA polymerase sigma factor [Tepidisphaeraceae bacterium]